MSGTSLQRSATQRMPQALAKSASTLLRPRHLGRERSSSRLRLLTPDAVVQGVLRDTTRTAIGLLGRCPSTQVRQIVHSREVLTGETTNPRGRLLLGQPA